MKRTSHKTCSWFCCDYFIYLFHLFFIFILFLFFFFFVFHTDNSVWICVIHLPIIFRAAILGLRQSYVYLYDLLTHILQHCFNVTGEIRLPQWQWSNVEGYGRVNHTNTQRTDDKTTLKQSRTKQCTYFMGYTASVAYRGANNQPQET